MSIAMFPLTAPS